MINASTRIKRVAATVAALLALTACASDSAPTSDQSAQAAAPTSSAGASAAPGSDSRNAASESCGGDVAYSPLPDDLRSDQISRYAELVMDGKTVMRFAIGSDLTDAQVERAVRLTRFYLQDVPGSTYGADKSAVRETLAANRATMIMPNGAHQEGNDIGLRGQELYADEIAAEGSDWYVSNNFRHRDASMEEIFHQIHDAGIGTNRPGALPSYQSEMLARAEATAGTVWAIDATDWVAELRDEGSLAQEYIASVIDSWYGLWGPFDEPGGMWGTYLAKTRGDVRVQDPEGAALLSAFLPDVLEYEAYIDATFAGTFSLAFDEAEPYTHKSQYLRGARLTGGSDAGLLGNDLDNTLRGNSGDNLLDGGDGDDTAIYCNSQNQYQVTTTDGVTTVSGPDGTDTLMNIETIAFIDAYDALVVDDPVKDRGTKRHEDDGRAPATYPPDGDRRRAGCVRRHRLRRPRRAER